jgi:Raf kinase inhibitor-like YbhB/YbcL family protein
MARAFLPLGLFLFFLLATGSHARQSANNKSSKGGQTMQLASSAFQPGGNIPKQFTCEGSDISPELTWQGAPSGTKAFALIVHDPDAPRAGGFYHWAAYNIPASANRISENAAKQSELAGGGTQGRNDFGNIGYGGPCPPSGTHRYFFRLYALDSELKLDTGATAKDVEKAMQGHILGEAELMGKYQKSSQRAA